MFFSDSSGGVFMRNRIRKIDRAVDFVALERHLAELRNPCNACPRRCGVRRIAGEPGFCSVTEARAPSKSFISFGEEKILNPAWMLYLPGCNMRCAYCSNMEFVDGSTVTSAEWDPAAAASAIDRAFAEKRIKVLQLLGGEPMVSLESSLQVVARLQSRVPIVWNSNFYCSPELFELVMEFADFFVADLKFGNDRCAMAFAGTPQYWETVTANLERVPRDRMLIRHLALGGHLDCCALPVIDFLGARFADVPVAFHELMPDKTGRCRKTDARERREIGKKIKQYRLKRRKFAYNFSAEAADGQPDCFSGEILIRKDGTVTVQDVPDHIRTLLNRLLGE